MFVIPDGKTEVLQRAITTYGNAAQLGMLIEECAELIKAVCKVLRDGDTQVNELDLLDEVADVFIMLSQLEMIYGATAEVNARIDYKVRRLERRLDELDEERG